MAIEGSEHLSKMPLNAHPPCQTDNGQFISTIQRASLMGRLVRLTYPLRAADIRS